MTTYRVLAQENGLYGAEVTELNKAPSIHPGFATEADAAAWIAQQKKRMEVFGERWKRRSPGYVRRQ
jgi:hypothetical protein